MVSPLPELVTLKQAKKHVVIRHHDDDDDIYLKLEQATYMVLEYIWRDDDDWIETMVGWDDTTVPKSIQAAVLVQFAELYRFRGDDEQKAIPERQHGFLSPMVTAYLHRWRDPSLA